MFPHIRRYATEAGKAHGSRRAAAGCAADILYKNPGAIQNRLELFHLNRLRTQLALDRPSLLAMRREWDGEAVTGCVRITTRCPDNLPGIEAQFDPKAGAVSLSVLVESLDLTASQQEVLLKLSGERYIPEERALKFEVAAFPFKEQNQKLAIQILTDLVAYVRNEANECFEDVPVLQARGRSKPELAFPTSWLK